MNYERIERAIAFFGMGEHHHITVEDARDVSESLRLLLDVARAADDYCWSTKHGKTAEAMNCYLQSLDSVLTALKEHCDE